MHNTTRKCIHPRDFCEMDIHLSDSIVTNANEETFLQDLLVTLKQILQNENT